MFKLAIEKNSEKYRSEYGSNGIKLTIEKTAKSISLEI
jgi:hypothetical protein